MTSELTIEPMKFRVSRGFHSTKPRKSRNAPSHTKRSRGGANKAKSGVALKIEWNVPKKTTLRYVGIRGIYWYWLSRDVRRTEWEKWGGECLTCLERIDDWKDADCGHIVSSKVCGEYLRLNRANLTIQHKKCNNPRFSPMAAAHNAINYDKRYGHGSFTKLWESRKTEAKEPKRSEYPALIRELQSYRESIIK